MQSRTVFALWRVYFIFVEALVDACCELLKKEPSLSFWWLDSVHMWLDNFFFETVSLLQRRRKQNNANRTL